MYGHESYKTNDIETASQIKLIVMLYEGAIRFSKIAKNSIENNQFDLANTNMIKAQNIVGELIASLNFDAGALAYELSELYLYIHRILIEANIQKNTVLINEAIELLENLKNGWDNLLSQENNADYIKNINISG